MFRRRTDCGTGNGANYTTDCCTIRTADNGSSDCTACGTIDVRLQCKTELATSTRSVATAMCLIDTTLSPEEFEWGDKYERSTMLFPLQSLVAAELSL